MVDKTLPQENPDRLYLNALSLHADFEWFSAVVNARMKLTFDQECEYSSIYDIAPPSKEGDTSPYADFVVHYNLAYEERIILLLALAPHIAPQLLDVFFARNSFTDRGYTEFGGLKGSSHAGFLPTIETAYFVLAGNDLAKRFYLNKYFRREHFFHVLNILSIDPLNANEPEASGLLKITDEYVDYFTNYEVRKPMFSHDFPARQITTPLEWKDLVVEEFTERQLEEVKAWLIHGSTLLNDWGMARNLKPGFKILFHGPPGTGKTLTASLFGKWAGTDVYRIDLSTVVSKYIGETAKNLEKAFKKAENKNWVLFFDEADALLGKRTAISDAHDKYANQEVSYLLQRLEDYAGLVILATNQKSNMDEAFNRRLQAVIYFPMPKAKERLKLWLNAFSSESELEEGFDIASVADKYKIAGGSIMNVVRYSSLMALNRGENVIRKFDVIEGIKRELEKEGKTI
jgi:DNA polymerase III delta prime subunit